jgi:3-isopropylmalate dehydratase small subunit
MSLCEDSRLRISGCGVKCVIAKSYAFIFQRNMPSLGLLGITVSDDSFYDAAVDGAEISVDINNNKILLYGKEIRFQLSEIEKGLHDNGGITSAFNKFGTRLFEVLTTPKNLPGDAGLSESTHSKLQW